MLPIIKNYSFYKKEYDIKSIRVSRNISCFEAVVCCLLTPMSLASGGSPIFPLVAQQYSHSGGVCPQIQG